MPASTMHAMTRGYAGLRKGRCSLAGHAYLVTFATCKRHPHFSDPVVAFDACRWLASGAAWLDARLLAWILMPDHWHGILQLGDTQDLSGSVGTAKGRVARALRAKHPQVGTVWQDGFHDRAIRGEAHLLQAARYIVMNPVRAGIVRRAGDYPYWDAMWLSGGDRDAGRAHGDRG